MGYRLEISKIEYKATGGKLYGYVDNIEELESYKWLLNKGYITNEDKDNWDYGFNPQIIIRSDEFKEFIELYKKDYKNTHETDYLDNENYDELTKNTNDVLLEWW